MKTSLCLLFLLTYQLLGAEKNPIELGTVTWGRDYEAAQKVSANSEKPILLLFQEVPG